MLLARRNRFELRPPGVLERAFRRVRYRACYERNALVPPLDEQQRRHLDTLRRDGTLILPGYLGAATLRALQAETQRSLEALQFETPCLAQSRVDPARHRDLIDNYLYGSPEQFQARGVAFDRGEVRSLEQVEREFQPSTLTVYPLAGSAAFRGVLLDPYLLAIICHYLGLVPKLLEAYVRRNYPGPFRTMNHFWHRDLNDSLQLVKMFVFLSDTTVDNGPHEFVRGSHQDYTLNGKRYYEDVDIDRVYPAQSPARLVSEVAAGTVILEDTRGLHRARMPDSGVRDLGYGVYFPVADGNEPCCYGMPREAADKLSSLQRAFIPAACLSGA
jgi:hypothetical protein